MRTITVTDCYGIEHQEVVYNCQDLPINEILKECQYVRKRFDSYVNVPCAFDIETTSVDGDKPYGFMYHWQFCIRDSVCFGRTWEEFSILLKRLQQAIAYSPDTKWVVYAHQLAFEFQFMQNFITITSLFARDKRKPLTVRTCEQIEFRCSYFLSNMSLSNFCKTSKGCTFWKKDGDSYNYEKFRTPFTPLTPFEEEYCYCDVRGLCQAIQSRLDEGDTIATIPLTSTGYVRREFREAMKANERNRRIFEALRLTPAQYELCKEAFRGGNTSSNTLYVDELLSDIDSFDIQSSYPAAMLMDKFPMGKFMRVTINSREKFDKYINSKACLFRIVIEDLSVKNLFTIPYIARSKCTKITKGKYGNGRVLSAKRIEMVVTDVDWKIIEKHYNMGAKVVPEMYVAEYGYLPLDFRKQLLHYFVQKCTLKHQLEELEKCGKEDSDEYKDIKFLYDKFKNRINAAYGMMVTDIASPEIALEDGEWKSYDADVQSALDRYYKSNNSFLSYQHGVWVTANARKRLQDMLDVVGIDCVYIDTDSIKCIGDHKEEFARANELHYKYMSELPLDVRVVVAGKTYYIGDWEYEGTYKEFKTLGSKKYVSKNSKDKVVLTLAGVNKEKGSKYFAEHGCDAFRKDLELKHEVAGRTTAYYNTENIHKLDFGDGEFTTASNIAIIPGGYTIGVTDEYQELIELIKAS